MRRTRSYSFHVLRGHPLYRLFLEAQETQRRCQKVHKTGKLARLGPHAELGLCDGWVVS